MGATALAVLLGALGVPFATAPAHAADPNLRCMGLVPTIVGTNGNDLLNGTPGVDVIAGLDGDDRISAMSGNDVICGGDGTNTLDGGPDQDVMQGGSGADAFYGSDGVDEVSYAGSYEEVVADLRSRTASGQGNDVFSSIENLTGSLGDDYLTGDSGDNRLAGLTGSDFLLGNEGQDILAEGASYADDVNQFIGGPGYDVLYGGTGTDVANFNGSMFTVNVDLSTGAATSADGIDQLSGMDDVIGSIYNDVIRGNGSANDLFGNGGDDRIFGGGGPDTLEGSSGDDQLHGEAGADRASFAGSFAPATASLATGRAADGSGGNDTFDTIEGLVGGAGNDVLTGAATNDSLHGGPGNDRLDGAGGIDVADFDGAGRGVVADLQTGRAVGDDTGTDTLLRIEDLRGGTQADLLRGNAGPNRLVGDRNDTVEGRQGDDVLDLVDQSAAISYASAPGPVTIDAVAGRVTGAAGTDRILGPGVRQITGGPFADRITCSSAVSSCGVSGGAGDDVITGTASSDDFTPGPGNDRIIGGTGTDFVAYYDAPAPIVADLRIGRVTGEGTDTVTGVEAVLGTDFNDRITGIDAPGCMLEGGDGDDRLVAPGPAPCWLSGGRGNDTHLGGAGNDRIYPSTGSDVVRGGAGNDEVQPSDGGDDLDGGAGVDLLDLRYATGGVQVDLQAGTITGAWTSRATTFENLVGTIYNDTLRGSDQPNVVDGSDGDDTIFGADGNDVLRGSLGRDWLHGLEGDDTIDGGNGSDTTYGGNGVDTVAFDASSAAVSANLQLGTAVSGPDSDTMIGFENLTGSGLGDTLTGDPGPNVIDGKAGTDTCSGGGGADTLQNCP